MNELNITMDTLLMILPLIVLQFGLALYCIVKIVREGVANLNKPLWILISIFFSMIGPIVFLIVGRKKAR